MIRSGRTTLVAVHIAGWLVLGLVAPAVGDPTVFYDGTFSNADWASTIFYEGGGGGSQEAWQETSGGNPGAFRRTRIHLDSGGPTAVWAFHYQPSAVYDPGVSGPIGTVDYQEDMLQIDNVQTAGAALRQDGKVYRGNGAFTDNTSWTTRSVTELTASDFSLIGDSSAHPDFSTAGSPIEFGFFRASSTPGAGGYWTDDGIDNWAVTVHPDSEPVNLLANSGFEIPVDTTGSWPNKTGAWHGDDSGIVATSGGVTPFDGSKMFEFRHTGSGQSAGSYTTSQVYQLVNVSDYRHAIEDATAVARVSALFNRLPGDAETDTEFSLYLLACGGNPSTFRDPATRQVLLAVHETLSTDDELSSWEEIKFDALLPIETDYVAIELVVREDVFNDTSGVEFDGHYADGVSFKIIPEPATLGLLALGGLIMLIRRDPA